MSIPCSWVVQLEVLESFVPLTTNNESACKSFWSNFGIYPTLTASIVPSASWPRVLRSLTWLMLCFLSGILALSLPPIAAWELLLKHNLDHVNSSLKTSDLESKSLQWLPSLSRDLAAVFSLDLTLNLSLSPIPGTLVPCSPGQASALGPLHWLVFLPGMLLPWIAIWFTFLLFCFGKK